MENIGDKGISAGEGSNVVGKNIQILNAEIGVASKDESIVEINNITVQDSKIGYSAYQKKSEFGTAKLLLSESKILNVDVQYLLENGSSILENNIRIKPNEENIKELLY